MTEAEIVNNPASKVIGKKTRTETEIEIEIKNLLEDMAIAEKVGIVQQSQELPRKRKLIKKI